MKPIIKYIPWCRLEIWKVLSLKLTKKNSRNKGLTQCRITMKFLHNFFKPWSIFSSHTMFINTSTKKLTLVNNAILSHGIAIEHFLCYKMVANVYLKLDNILKTRHIPFWFNAMSDHHEINSYAIFFKPWSIFSSHTMFINTSTKKLTLVNNAILSHGIAIEHFLCYKMVANVY